MSRTDLNSIIKNFGEVKKNYLEMQSDYQCLKEDIEKLRKRLADKEQQRLRLISMLKDRVSEYVAKIDGLKEEKNHLKTIIQDQSRLIEEQSDRLLELKQLTVEQSNTIDELKKEMETLRNRNSRTNYKNNVIDRGIHLISNDSNNRFNKLKHPSFDNDTLEPKKRQRALKNRKNGIWSQCRWTNLDITVKGNGKEGANSPSQKVNDSIKSVTKRKLYAPDDDIVDLNTEEED